MWLLLLVSLSACTRHALGVNLPFQVESIAPNGTTYSADARYQLSATTPITIIFSRPVVPLDANFSTISRTATVGSSTLTGDDLVFLSVNANSGGMLHVQMRWLTTFVLRIDPVTEWPSDVLFCVHFNQNARSYDGQQLTNSGLVFKYRGAYQSVSLDSVTSGQAQNFTDNQWSSRMLASPEVPPDGVVRLVFNYEVQPSLLMNVVRIVEANSPGNNAANVVVTRKHCPITVSPLFYYYPFYGLPPQTTTPPVPSGPLTDTLTKELCISASNLLADTQYLIEFGMNTTVQYNPNAGVSQLRRIPIQGLGLFQFEFLHAYQTSYRRLRLWMRHGLPNAQSQLPTLKNAIQILDDRANSLMTFTIEVINKAYIQLSVPGLLPQRSYTVNVTAAPGVTDSYGLPLMPSVGPLTMKQLDGYFTSGVQHRFQFLNNDRPSTIKGLYRYSTHMSSVDVRYYEVTLANLASAMIAEGRSNQQPFGATPVASVSLGGTDTNLIQTIMPDLSNIAGNKILLKQTKTSSNYRSEFVVFSDLIVSVVTLSTEYVVIIVRDSAGAPVIGASIKLFLTRSYNNIGVEIMAQNSIVTDSDGVAATPLNDVNICASCHSQNLGVHVTHAASGAVGFSGRVRLVATYNSGSPRAKLILDRALYQPGHVVDIKGYVREMGVSTWAVPEVAKSSVKVVWDSASGFETVVPVVVDSSFGTFEATINVPPAGYTGRYTVMLYSGTSYVTGQSFVVADVRRPTITVDFSTNYAYVDPNATDFTVSARVLTDTKLPINGAQITLHVTLSNNANSMTRTTAMTSDSTGLAAKIIDLAMLFGNSPALGTTAEFRMEYTGPTGEYIDKSLSRELKLSPWTISTSISSPTTVFPGWSFEATVDVTDASQSSVSANGAQVYLVVCQAAATCVCRNSLVLSSATVSGSNPRFTLPASHVGTFGVYAEIVDPNGLTIQSSCEFVGMDAVGYAKKTAQFPDVADAALDKDLYVIGATATINFYSPFANSFVAVVWGNTLARQKKVQRGVSAGWGSISFVIGSECLGNCNAALIISSAGQSWNFPNGVQFSPNFDPQLPFVQSKTLFMEVVEPDDFFVSVTAPTTTTPRAKINVDVSLSDQNGAPVSGEVVVFAVDKAYYQLKPLPMTNLSLTYRKYLAISPSIMDGSKALQSSAIIDAIFNVSHSRAITEPWYSPMLPYSRFSYVGDASKTDAAFYRDLFTTITNEHVEPYPMFGGPELSFGGGIADTTLVSRSSGPALTTPTAQGGTGLVRSNFQVTPLFHTVKIDSSGRAQIPFDLPDNIGTFEIRVYAVNMATKFSSAKAEVVSSKNVYLKPNQPLFVRTGDQFDSGVIVTADQLPSDTKSVEVNGASAQTQASRTNAGGELLGGLPASATKVITGSNPVSYRFSFTASTTSTGSSSLVWQAIDKTNGVNAIVDTLQTNLEVMGMSDTVALGTSVTIPVQPGKTFLWRERVVAPAGSTPIDFQVAIGLGSLSAVRTMSEKLYNAVLRSKTSGYVDVQGFLGALVAIKILKLMGDTSISSPVLANLESERVFCVDQLNLLTLDNVGLRWSARSSSRYVSPYLQAYAIYAAKRAGGLDPRLALAIETWKTALNTYWRDACNKYENCQDNRQLLSLSYLAMGTQWSAPNPALNLLDLQTHEQVANRAGSTAILCAAHQSDGRPADSFVSNAHGSLFNWIRWQGRTAYLSDPMSSFDSAALGGDVQSFALTCLSSVTDVADRNVIAAISTFVADGSNTNHYWYYVPTKESWLAIIGLYDYDKSVGAVKASSNVELYKTDTTPANLWKSMQLDSVQKPVEVAAGQWSSITNSNHGDFFISATGNGELRAVLLLNYIPGLTGSPLYRGMHVERIIRRVDAATGRSLGQNVQLAATGITLEITIQVTLFDTFFDVYLEDYVPAGLEPIDPLVTSSGVSSSTSSSTPSFGGRGLPVIDYYCWYCWYPTFGSASISKSRVSWEARQLNRGTHSVTYLVRTVTPGIFAHPGARAYAKNQPEVMGMSPGYHFVIEANSAVETWTSAQVSAFLSTISIPSYKSLVGTARFCSTGCDAQGVGFCNLRTGACEYNSGAFTSNSTLSVTTTVSPLAAAPTSAPTSATKGGHINGAFRVFSVSSIAVVCALLAFA